MTFTSSVLKMQSILQKVVPQPCHFNQFGSHTKNHRYSTKTIKLFRIFTLFIAFLVAMPPVIYRLCWLIFHWKSYTVHRVDQAVVYGSIFCTLVIILGIYHLQLRFCEQTIYILNQMYRLGLL